MCGRGYDQATWDEQLEESFTDEPAAGAATGPVSTTEASPALPPAMPAVASADNASIASLIANIEGLSLLTDGMGAAVKEAAYCWCVENDVPSIQLLVDGGFQGELLSHLAERSSVKAGGLQDRMLRKRLAL